MQTPLVNQIIDLEKMLKQFFKKGEYIAIKSVITPLVIITLDAMRSTTPTMEENHLRSGLSGKTNYSRP